MHVKPHVLCQVLLWLTFLFISRAEFHAWKFLSGIASQIQIVKPLLLYQKSCYSFLFSQSFGSRSSVVLALLHGGEQGHAVLGQEAQCRARQDGCKCRACAGSLRTLCPCRAQEVPGAPSPLQPRSIPLLPAARDTHRRTECFPRNLLYHRPSWKPSAWQWISKSLPAFHPCIPRSLSAWHRRDRAAPALGGQLPICSKEHAKKREGLRRNMLTICSLCLA